MSRLSVGSVSELRDVSKMSLWTSRPSRTSQSWHLSAPPNLLDLSSYSEVSSRINQMSPSERGRPQKHLQDDVSGSAMFIL